jgi:hypothetical protein
MGQLKVMKTVEPEEEFRTKEEWLEAIGVRPVYRQDGSSILKEAEFDDHIYLTRILKHIPVFTKASWEKHQELITLTLKK